MNYIGFKYHLQYWRPQQAVDISSLAKQIYVYHSQGKTEVPKANS